MPSDGTPITTTDPGLQSDQGGLVAATEGIVSAETEGAIQGRGMMVHGNAAR